MAVPEVMSVSEMGMKYQKLRAEAASQNIANANVVQPSNGQGFKPLGVVIEGSRFEGLVNAEQPRLQALDTPHKQVFQPEHAAADDRGYVHYPNVDVAEQMIILTEATRAYEANIKAFNAQLDMTYKAFEIGK